MNMDMGTSSMNMGGMAATPTSAMASATAPAAMAMDMGTGSCKISVRPALNIWLRVLISNCVYLMRFLDALELGNR